MEVVRYTPKTLSAEERRVKRELEAKQRRREIERDLRQAKGGAVLVIEDGKAIALFVPQDA